MTNDRQVHAEADTDEGVVKAVRYDRAGKWKLEYFEGTGRLLRVDPCTLGEVVSYFKHLDHSGPTSNTLTTVGLRCACLMPPAERCSSFG